MGGEELIKRTIAERQSAGFSLLAYGAEGFTAEQPFTCHARDAEQRDRWIEQLSERGFTVGAAQ